jgi:putative phosphoribosyl transferase
VRYRDRIDGGRRLVAELESAGYEGEAGVLVLGVARGGLPVAAEVASSLGAELDVAVARKLGAPGNPEFAIGAIAAGGEPILNERVIQAYRIPSDYIDHVVARERSEIERRSAAYRSGRPARSPADRTVIVVDDGVATGSTLIAVLRWVRSAGARRVVCAVPVGPPETVRLLEDEADEVVCPLQPRSFMAVGGWYDDFRQLSDEEVVAFLEGG